MNKKVSGLVVLFVAALLTFMLAPVAQARPSAAPPFQGRPSVTVMSQNLYLGADLTPVIVAPDFPSFLAATTTVYVSAQATNFPERAEAIAAEIAANEPLLVGLQEATMWRTGPAFDPAPATTVVTDFLQLILDELDAAGADYVPVVVQEGFDFEAPTLAGVDARLTISDVILARDDLANLKLSNPQSAVYTTSLTLPTVAGPVQIPRQWVAIDAKFRGRSFRFISTQLESFVQPVRVGQALELLAGPVNTNSPVILVGDLNSELSDAGDSASLVASAGFTDAWGATNPGDPGYTCCQAADLLNPVSQLSERIDFVFSRGDIAALDMALVGEDTADRTPSGLWPSDHAGLAATLRVRP